MVFLNHQSATPPENVADAPLAAVGVNHPATLGVPLLGVIARFTDANPLATAWDFTATITWGDGHTSAGTIQPGLSGGFIVLATNSFAGRDIHGHRRHRGRGRQHYDR